MKSATAILLLTALLFSCKKEQVKDDLIICGIGPDAKLTLALNNCSGSDSLGKASGICFEQLEESRCPTNVACPYAGKAVAKFSFSVNGTQHRFSLFTPGGKDTLVAGYRFKLIDVTPHPVYPGTGPSGLARAILQITR